MTPANNAASQLLSPETQKVFASYSQLGTDDKLALLYYIYEAMGESITPAAPTAADPNLAPRLLGDYFTLSQDEQLAIMRQIAAGDDSDYSRAYGALGLNNKLMVWFAWAQGMGETVVDMPANYQAPQSLNSTLDQIKNLEFQEQISVLREIANQMGHTDVQAIPSQAETGKTSSL